MGVAGSGRGGLAGNGRGQWWWMGGRVTGQAVAGRVAGRQEVAGSVGVGSGRRGQAVASGGVGDGNGREMEVAGSGRRRPVLKLWREARGGGGQSGPKVGWRPGPARPGFFKAPSHGAVCYC